MVDGDVFCTLYLRNPPKFSKLNVFNGFLRFVFGLKTPKDTKSTKFLQGNTLRVLRALRGELKKEKLAKRLVTILRPGPWGRGSTDAWLLPALRRPA